MFTNVIRKSRKIVTSVKNRFAPTATELKLRREVAFDVLHPHVECVKRSPTAQIVVGVAVTALVLSGRWSTAAGIASAWLFSMPLTNAVAGGVGAVGMVDAKLLAAIERLRQSQIEPVEASVTA